MGEAGAAGMIIVVAHDYLSRSSRAADALFVRVNEIVAAGWAVYDCSQSAVGQHTASRR